MLSGRKYGNSVIELEKKKDPMKSYAKHGPKTLVLAHLALQFIS